MKTWIALYTLAVFAGGACLGVAVERTCGARGRAPAGPPLSSHRRELSVTELAQRLGLTEEQDRELDFILGETQRDVEAFQRAIRERHERSRDRILALLTADQRKKLEEIRNAEDRKRRQEEIDRSLRFYTRLLELDEARAAAVRAVLSDLEEGKRSFFRDERWGDDLTRIRPYLQEMKEEQNRRFQSILTPEQYRRYLEFQEWEH